LAQPDVPAFVKEENPPPPPVDVAVVVCTSGCAVFDGTYMSNGDALALTTAVAAAQGDGTCVYPGHASLKIDKQLEPVVVAAATSSNAQIKCRDQRASGNGTIEIGAVAVDLDNVLVFNNPPDCTAQCGNFTATDDDGGVVNGFIFEREYYEEVCENSEGGPYVCIPEGRPEGPPIG